MSEPIKKGYGEWSWEESSERADAAEAEILAELRLWRAALVAVITAAVLAAVLLPAGVLSVLAT